MRSIGLSGTLRVPCLTTFVGMVAPLRFYAGQGHRADETARVLIAAGTCLNRFHPLYARSGQTTVHQNRNAASTRSRRWGVFPAKGEAT